MMTSLLSPQDLTWLFETHLSAFSNLRTSTIAAVVYGNEDAPDMIDLHDVDHYAAPFRRFVSDDSGTMQYLGVLSDVTRTPADKR